MLKRIFALLMAMCVCAGVSTSAFASEVYIETEENYADEVLMVAETDNDGWAPLTPPTDARGVSDGILPYAGVETWKYTGYVGTYVGGFTMSGTNLTPVKTIEKSNLNQYLSINADFTCSQPGILTLQIREYPSGKVLAQSKSNATTSGNVKVEAGGGMSGKKVQIFFKITDKNGNFSASRQCNIKYWYWLSGYTNP